MSRSFRDRPELPEDPESMQDVPELRESDNWQTNYPSEQRPSTGKNQLSASALQVDIGKRLVAALIDITARKEKR